MKLSKLLGERTKNSPADAVMKSHALMLRAGYMKQVANGIYTLTALGQRACTNIENIVRNEMNALDGQEVKFPVVMPKELWDLSGRYSSIGSEMVRFDDRTGHKMLLGMTHEEAAVHLAKNWANNYNQFPFMIYQIQTKFRDEPRSRAGLIRVREFVMKDAYSFHMSQDDLNDYYSKMHDAYERFYQKIGLKNVLSVKSDNGMFGGNLSHEFMYVNDFGEDEIVTCKECSYRANQEVAECVYPSVSSDEEPKELEIVNTGNAKEIADLASKLGVSPKKCVKAVAFAVKNSSQIVLCFVRGDKDVNETKLRKLCAKDVVKADLQNDQILCAGNIGPVNLIVPSNFEVFFDLSLKGTKNMIVGANKPNLHFKNFNIERDLKNVEFVDISKVCKDDLCPQCGKRSVKIVHGIEVGNIFQLGTKYTSSMGMLARTPNGQDINPIMGCYGIGIGRSLACVVEENSDEHGICLPFAVAPFKVVVSPIRYDDQKVFEVGNKIYQNLSKNGISAILDDREVTPGTKFADADLIGIPLRVVVSPRSLENNQIELKLRKTGEIVMCDVEDVMQKIEQIISQNL